MKLSVEEGLIEDPLDVKLLYVNNLGSLRLRSGVGGLLRLQVVELTLRLRSGIGVSTSLRGLSLRGRGDPVPQSPNHQITKLPN